MYFFISSDILVNGNKQDDGVIQTLDLQSTTISHCIYLEHLHFSIGDVMRLHSLGDYDFNEFWMTPGTSTDLIFQVGLAFILLIHLALGAPYPGKIIAQFFVMVFCVRYKQVCPPVSYCHR